MNSKFFDNQSSFAVAFSGGGDSTALLYWLTQKFGAECVFAVHFNHGLRSESDAEQQQLAKLCEAWGVTFITDKWQQKPEGNIQQVARKARYQFFAKVCREYNFSCIYTGHNRDDIAENFLMRIARGSGLRGLSAIAEQTEIEGVTVYRPLLEKSRDEIREYLKEHHVSWLEDPSNENDKFFRVRVRKHKKELEDIGISFEHIVASSKSLHRADALVTKVVDDYYRRHVCTEGELLKCTVGVLSEPEELCLRVISRMITALTGEQMPARISKRQRLINHLQTSDKRYELSGVAFSKKQGTIFAEKV